MAKTKLTQVKKKLELAAKAKAVAKPALKEPVVPPPVRVTGKSADPTSSARDSEKKPSMSRKAPSQQPAAPETLETPENPETLETRKAMELPPFDITWDNLHKVMEWFDMKEHDAVSVLLQVVGPDPRGAQFWDTYKQRVKKETNDVALAPKDEAAAESEPKRRRLRPVPEPDNQLGDPDLYPDVESGNPAVVPDQEMEIDDTQLDGEPWEEGEEEDEREEDEEVEVAATSHGGDDQDSPSGGATTVAGDHDETQQVCSPMPLEPVEPVMVPAVENKDAQDAKEALEAALRSSPTPSRRRVIAQDVQRIDGPGDSTSPAAPGSNLRSLKFPGKEGCFHHRFWTLFVVDVVLWTFPSPFVGEWNLCIQGRARHWCLASSDSRSRHPASTRALLTQMMLTCMMSFPPVIAMLRNSKPIFLPFFTSAIFLADWVCYLHVWGWGPLLHSWWKKESWWTLWNRWAIFRLRWMIRRPDKSWNLWPPACSLPRRRMLRTVGIHLLPSQRELPCQSPLRSRQPHLLYQSQLRTWELQRGLLQLQGPSLQKLRVLDQISVFKLWWTSSRLASRCQQRGSSRILRMKLNSPAPPIARVTRVWPGGWRNWTFRRFPRCIVFGQAAGRTSVMLVLLFSRK